MEGKFTGKPEGNGSLTRSNETLFATHGIIRRKPDIRPAGWHLARSPDCQGASNRQYLWIKSFKQRRMAALLGTSRPAARRAC
ncbi:hypothetical protein, partial [Nonomuraea cavernae]|uniref:hypothetical protein n=1 Tax=Nonomuraea cavernae TaxID=2045107 RepID=UPI0033F34F1A